ncbi:MAG: GtrA family protein [Candidatus Saccharimonadaceae bacterium]
MNTLTEKNVEKLRFVAVGGINTAIDFGFLFLLKMIGLPVIAANIGSTSLAFIFSFFANKKYTFKSRSKNVRRELILFVLVTLTGLWLIQGSIIWFLMWLTNGSGYDESVRLLVAKLIATVVSLTWNYVFYSKLVFSEKDEK